MAIPTIEPTVIPPAIATSTPNSPAPLDRSMSDRADEVSGYQIHVMYVLPSDGIDQHLDTDGTLAKSVESFEQWLAAQTGGPRLRLDTYQGMIDITFYPLPRTNADIADHGAYVRDEVQADLQRAGFDASNKLYAVYYDGASTYACGGGAWPPTLTGNVAALYLQGAYGSVHCNANSFTASTDTPGYLEFSMIHEIFHTLGAVAACAPHQVLSGHVSDSNTDLMFAGNQPWNPAALDVGHDDYYGHSNPNCVDIAKSVFIDPLPENAVKPPGWQ